MLNRMLCGAGALACAIALSTAAAAAPAMATGAVNLRTGPGRNYRVITTIPAGAPLEVFGCSGWCQVSFDGREGYVSGNYIAGARYQAAPVYVERAPPPVVYFDYSDRDRWDNDWRWRHRHGGDHWRHRQNGFGVYFGF